MSFAGFDASGFPGVAAMAWLKQHTNLAWCGFYFSAPSHPDNGWMPRRGALITQGWGLAPIYVGAQVTGPGSHKVTATQGKIDGVDTWAQLAKAGFPVGSYVYLDLENGPPFTAAQSAYVGAWIDAVRAGGYGAGVYCSFQIAAQVRAVRSGLLRLWVFHVQTTKAHAVDGPNFTILDPAKSGFAGAVIWQHDDEARIVCSSVAGAARIGVDLDSSTMADPGAPDAVDAQPVAAHTPDPATAPPKVASVEALQSALNVLGASPKLDADGDLGDLTKQALYDLVNGLLDAKAPAA